MYIITKMPHKRCVAFCYINKFNFVDGQDSIIIIIIETFEITRQYITQM